MKTIRGKFKVPIFECNVHVALTDDINAERRRLSAIFGELPQADLLGCVIFREQNFALLLETKDRSVVAHEIFHLTQFILEYCDTRVCHETSEVSASLCGYLTLEVNRKLRLS